MSDGWASANNGRVWTQTWCWKKKHNTRSTQTILSCWEFVQPNSCETSKQILGPVVTSFCFWSEVRFHPCCTTVQQKLDQQICVNFISIKWGSSTILRSLNDIIVGNWVVWVGYKMVNFCWDQKTDRATSGPLDYGQVLPIEGIIKSGNKTHKQASKSKSVT